MLPSSGCEVLMCETAVWMWVHELCTVRMFMKRLYMKWVSAGQIYSDLKFFKFSYLIHQQNLINSDHH